MLTAGMKRAAMNGCGWGTLLASALWTACSWGAAPEPPALESAFDEPTPEISLEASRAVNLDELSDVRIVFTELQEQIRIASAKLDDEAMVRKYEMGRLTALAAATDAQLKLVSAQVQRLETRLQDLRQDAFGGDGSGAQAELPTAHPLAEPIARVQQQIAIQQDKLEQLARHRGGLKQRLDELHSEQIRELLRAAVTPGDGEPPQDAALERVLNRQNAPAAAEPASDGADAAGVKQQGRR